MNAEAHALHYGIAEQGKLLALKGQHAPALRHYQEALRLAVNQGAPELFFRHYTGCVLESLEHQGAFDDVVRYCDRVLAFYEQNPPPNPVAELDRAQHYERRGICHLKAGRSAAARADLEAALRLAGPGGLPLSEVALGWLRRGLHVDPRRLRAEQDRHRYFAVRADAVDPSMAVPLPEALSPPPLHR